MIRDANPQANDSWSACPPGTLRRMMGEVRENRRRAVVGRVTTVLALVCLLGTGTWLGAQMFLSPASHSPTEFAVLRCSDVEQLLIQYGHGGLAETMRERIASHLDECPHCRNEHERLQKEEAKKQTSWLATRVPAKT